MSPRQPFALIEFMLLSSDTILLTRLNFVNALLAAFSWVFDMESFLAERSLKKLLTSARSKVH